LQRPAQGRSRVIGGGDDIAGRIAWRYYGALLRGVIAGRYCGALYRSRRCSALKRGVIAGILAGRFNRDVLVGRFSGVLYRSILVGCLAGRNINLSNWYRCANKCGPLKWI
jgi:hypothetical protein